MDKSKISRINELARKSKENGLTEDEKIEQAKLRREYIDSMKNNLEAQLNQIRIVDEHGNQRKLRKKE